LRCRLNALKGDAVAEKQDPPVEEEDSAGEEIDFEDMRKLFLDEKENACPCLLEVIARREKAPIFSFMLSKNGTRQSLISFQATCISLTMFITALEYLKCYASLVQLEKYCLQVAGAIREG
jgi:hypothetical protein